MHISVAVFKLILVKLVEKPVPFVFGYISNIYTVHNYKPLNMVLMLFFCFSFLSVYFLIRMKSEPDYCIWEVIPLSINDQQPINLRTVLLTKLWLKRSWNCRCWLKRLESVWILWLFDSQQEARTDGLAYLSLLRCKLRYYVGYLWIEGSF